VGPFSLEYEPVEGHARQKRRLIESGEIRAVGFVYVGMALERNRVRSS